MHKRCQVADAVALCAGVCFSQSSVTNCFFLYDPQLRARISKVSLNTVLCTDTHGPDKQHVKYYGVLGWSISHKTSQIACPALGVAEDVALCVACSVCHSVCIW